tara:strand:+ start:29 stop:526 length:498 start_codon:yes stop_codon:yes gene_type:complete
MHRINLISTNKWRISIIKFLIIILPIAVITSYIFALYIIPETAVGRYVLEYIYYIFIVVFSIIMYFFITGVYYYRIKIDSYIVYITAYPIIFSQIKTRAFLDISHDMLIDYTFLNKSLAFNTTLVLRIKKQNRKLVAKRFNLTLISKKEIERISNILNKIIAKNN